MWCTLNVQYRMFLCTGNVFTFSGVEMLVLCSAFILLLYSLTWPDPFLCCNCATHYTLAENRVWPCEIDYLLCCCTAVTVHTVQYNSGGQGSGFEATELCVYVVPLCVSTCSLVRDHSQRSLCSPLYQKRCVWCGVVWCVSV